MGTDVPNPDFELDHEGHSGWTTGNILHPPDWDSARGNIYQWLKNYTPDFVLIELGTNDVFQCVKTDTAIKNLKTITDVLRKKNPQVKIFIAQIPPLGNQWADKKLCGDSVAYAQRLVEFNNAVKQFALMNNSKNSLIQVVDQYSGINPSVDMYDDIHPNKTGEKIMAQRWFDAIKPYLTKIEE
jgi:lysophospholipase L1-like esterase